MGLEALLGSPVSDSPAPTASPTMVALDDLHPGRYQPRTRMDEGSLYELAQSIKSQGVIQPVLVRPLGTGSGFEIIAGERRTRAARLAGLTEVPVLVKSVPDESAAVMALIENIQREDLNPLEEAQGLKRLTQEFGLTHEQAAQAVGRSRSTASNLLRLLNLSPSVQELLMAGDLDMGHARALLALEGAEQVQCAHEIASRQLTVREAEKRVQQRLGVTQTGSLGKRRVPDPAPVPSSAGGRDVQRMEQALSDRLMAEVSIAFQARKGRNQGAGEVRIAFSGLEDLQGILQRMGWNEEEAL